MHAIATAARLTPTETNDTMVRLKPQQNLITVLTFRQSARDKILNTTTISIQDKPYQITAYEAASTQTCKGVIHGIERGTPSAVLMRHLITTGAPILTARMMGQSLSAIITFGTILSWAALPPPPPPPKQNPGYVPVYQQAEYRCRPHRPKAQICQRCHGIGHRSAPFICEKCSRYLEEQNQPHDCDPKCKNCGESNPAIASTSLVKSPHNATPNLRAKRTPSPIPTDIPQTIPELFHFINNKLDRMMSILQDHSRKSVNGPLEQAIRSRPRKIPNRVVEPQETFIPDQSMDTQCRDADDDKWLAPPAGTDIPTALETLINHSGPLAESIRETWAGRAVRTRT
ncbi:hypothetical protein HPB47_004285 [Ixodes persulcatus]|uniref:Uncharacterized protein n=1 Tax=Ixodes persulcatus TaxID=34615 RepID=A0AC60PG61_IXOPE|nr:hypothetical protein HPB47_004285 [Ixodes persulcatus]